MKQTTKMTGAKSNLTGIKKHTFRSAYNSGNGNYSETHNDDGLTEQSHAPSCDINLILAQFMETGIMPNMKQNNPQYGDVSEIDFQDIQNQLAHAKTLFEELPDPVKAQFDNEPFKFLQFAENPENNPALVEMGLAHAPKGSLDPALQAEADQETTSLTADKSDKSDASEPLST
jgi:hypothetical protein